MNLKIKFLRTVFESPSGYRITKAIADDLDEITVVGYFMQVNYDDYYEVVVKEVVHPKFGLQYEIESIKKVVISQADKLIGYFASGLFFGIGHKTAEKIVDLLGDNAIELILEDSDCLTPINIGERKLNKFVSKLKELNTGDNIFNYLISIGISQKMATKIYSDFGDDIVEKIKHDPFYLYYKNSSKYSYNFCLDVCTKLNFEENNIVLQSAKLYNYIGEKMFNSGSTYLNISDIVINIDLENAISYLKDYNVLYTDDNIISYKRYYDAEMYISNYIKNLVGHNESNNIVIDDYLTNFEINLSNNQELAIDTVLKNKISIITGGPGTGKTTIIKFVCNVLLNYYNLNIEESIYDSDLVLLAPTGRAAKRMYESTGINASTIHRYLKWDLDNNSFLYNENSKCSAKVVIVDEFSMIDIVLFSNLLKALNEDIILIILGDERQLPSVECGNVLDDLINSNIISVSVLDKVHRQNSASLVDFMHSVRNYNIPSDLAKKFDDRNFIRVTSEKIMITIEQVMNRIKEKELNIFDFILLVPMYKGSVGIDNLNILCQNIFNSYNNDKAIVFNKKKFYVNDKVLLTKNFPNENVYNGDIGYIKSITSIDTIAFEIDFDGNIVVFKGEDLYAITLGYAISIHKSQGSEFKHVIVPISTEYSKMLKNNLVYTAITRAKDSLTIIGEESVFINCVCNDEVDKRNSFLKSLLSDKKEVSPYDFI